MDRAPASEISRRIAPFAAAMDDPGSSLAEMALAVSAAFQPQLDTMATEVALDELAADVASPTRDGVMRHLFADGRLAADTADYHHWRNSCIDQVVTRRLGMPITLAVVGIEVARRVGVPLDGVGMPGHFLVGTVGDRDWFADPYHGRTGLTRDECRALAAKLGVPTWHEHYLEPIPDRLIIARMLNNLKATTAQRRDRMRYAIVMQLRQELPEFIEEHAAAERALATFN